MEQIEHGVHVLCLFIIPFFLYNDQFPILPPMSPSGGGGAHTQLEWLGT